MELILKREDLKPEYAEIEFEEIQYKHFKAYARTAVDHCAVATFEQNPYGKKEIRSQVEA